MKQIKAMHIGKNELKITWEDESINTNVHIRNDGYMRLGLEYTDGVLTRIGNTNIHY